ncbi:MAG: hypothetical protein IJV64_12390, partial [Oscillospiraceae bacterium]|nr:hypothetical protein [Oscillospiraceae bacterium]
MKHEKRKGTAWMFAVTFFIIVAGLALSVVKTDAYNKVRHHETFSGPGLFQPENTGEREVSVAAVPRGSTWAKV